MGTLQEGLSNITTTAIPQSQRKTTTTPAPAAKRSGMDVVKALRARMADQQIAKATAAETEAAAAQQEEATEMVAELLYGDAALMTELSQLKRQKGRHPRGSDAANEVETSIDRLTDNQKVVLEDLASLKKSNPLAYTEGTRRYNTRQEALEMAESNRTLIGSVTDADIRSRRGGALQAGFIAVTANRDEAVFSLDRQGYVPASPNESVSANDPSIVEVAASLKELLDDVRKRKRNDDDKIVAELHRGGFFVSARRDPDGKGGQLPSELDLLRDEIRDEVRQQTGDKRRERWEPSEFLSGKGGQRYVAKVGFVDFIVLENRDGEFIAVKATSARAGRFLFTRPDHQADEGARVAAKSAPRIVQAGKTITPEDVSNVVDNQLRLALEADLHRETESTERREVAEELRDLSDVPDLVTTYNLSQKQAGTSVVDARLGDREAGEREERLTMRLTGDGEGTFVVSQHVPGTIEKVDPEKRWLARAFDKDGQPIPMSVEVFKQVEGWRKLIPANAWTDRNWQLARKTKELGATVVTSDNVPDLTGLNGMDGLYAFGVNDFRSNKYDQRRRPTDPIKEWSVPLGFVVKREGQTVEPVWAVPGPSANKLEKIGGAQSITALTPVFRAIFWNLLKAVAPRGENGQRVRIERPAHLQPVKRQDTPAATDTEE